MLKAHKVLVKQQDKRIKAFHDYCRKIDVKYQELAKGEKPSYLAPTFQTVKLFAHATKSMRSVPLYFVEENDEGEVTKTIALLKALQRSFTNESNSHIQILFFSSTHYLLIDVRLSSEKVDCFVLDAADMTGRTVSNELAAVFGHSYYHAPLPECVIIKLQHDEISCLFFTLSQAAAASKLNLHALAENLTMDKEHVPGTVRMISSDHLPLQLLKDTQCGEARMRKLIARVDERQQTFLCPKEWLASECLEYFEQVKKQLDKNVVNMGIYKTEFKKIMEAVKTLQDTHSEIRLLAMMNSECVGVHQHLNKENELLNSPR